MKVVILAGGLGTRLSEETEAKPKPMVEIGGKPILWHIMKIYQTHGYNEFIICLGYKGHVIKEFFYNYQMHNSNLIIDIEHGNIQMIGSKAENFKITLIDTGLDTKTAGRLLRVKPYLDNEQNFMLTYGDGVSNVDLRELASFHLKHGKIATVTAIQPEGKFGGMELFNDNVMNFIEKPKGDGKWINGGFFVLSKKVFEYLPRNADEVMWEETPLMDLANDGELMAFKHYGFWKCMDALRDKIALEDMWKSDTALWKIWNNENTSNR
jgi:glucose-1-phosphate cytidylyltransferase